MGKQLIDPHIKQALWDSLPEEGKELEYLMAVDSKEGKVILYTLEDKDSGIIYYPMQWRAAIFVALSLHSRAVEALMDKESIPKDNAELIISEYIDDVVERSNKVIKEEA